MHGKGRFTKDKNGHAVFRVDPQEVFPYEFETAEGYRARMEALKAQVIAGVDKFMKAPGIPHEPEKITKDVYESMIDKAKKAEKEVASDEDFTIVPLNPEDLPQEILQFLQGVKEDMGAKKEPISGEKEEQKSFILDGAKDIVYGPRQHLYGHASTNFSRIAHMWGPVMGVPVSKLQVGVAMMLLKIARATNLVEREASGGVPAKFSEIEDSMKDIAGYAEVVMRALYERPDGSRTTS